VQYQFNIPQTRHNRKRFRTEKVSRNYFDKFFKPQNIKLDKFRSKLSVPPECPAEPIRLDKVTLTGPTVFVAGRYNKFSRKLSQSPWILNGKRMSEGSVQEKIVEQVAPHFKASHASITFMSSGREDVDVRCLGKGRPFVLEIADSATTRLSSEQAGEMEQAVKASGVVCVRDLQLIQRFASLPFTRFLIHSLIHLSPFRSDRDELHHIKSGEEEKQKIYRALCNVTDGTDITIAMLEQLSIEREFVIQQWTPLRVLHRRTLMKRPRSIYSVKAHAVKGESNNFYHQTVSSLINIHNNRPTQSHCPGY